MPAETSNQVDAVNPPEPVEGAPASAPAGSSSAASSMPASSSVPAVQSDGIQQRPRSTRIRGSAPATATTTAAIAHTPPVQTDDSQQPSADTSATVTPPPATQGAPVTTSPASNPSASSPSAQPPTSSTTSVPRATPAPFGPPETSAPSPEPAVDAVQSPDLPPSSVQREDARGEVAEREDARQPADSADNPHTNAAPGSPASAENQAPGSQPPSKPQNVPVARPATAPPADSATGITAPPPSSNTPRPATTPISSVAYASAVYAGADDTDLESPHRPCRRPLFQDPIRREFARSTTASRSRRHSSVDTSVRHVTPGGPHQSSPTPLFNAEPPPHPASEMHIRVTTSLTQMGHPRLPQGRDHLRQRQLSVRVERHRHFSQRRQHSPQTRRHRRARSSRRSRRRRNRTPPDQPTPSSTESPTTITVPADIRAAVAATTGVSPATASVVRGGTVSQRARDLQADAFTHQGRVHLPGNAPLTSDPQRRLFGARAHTRGPTKQRQTGAG